MSIKQERQADVWERWDWLWTAIFYAAVLIPTALMLFDDDRAAPAWVALLLTGMLLLWHWGGLKLAYRDLTDWDERPLLRFIIIIGDVVIWFVLVNISPFYYFTLFGLFGQIFRNLPIRYGVATVLILTAAIIYEQLTDAGESFSVTNPMIWLFFFMALAGIILAVWISAIIGQSTQRRELIE